MNLLVDPDPPPPKKKKNLHKALKLKLEKETHQTKRVIEHLSSSLTSTTLPEMGDIKSLVALTISTAPKLPCNTGAPSSGNST